MRPGGAALVALAAVALAVPVTAAETASAVDYGRYLGGVSCSFGGSKIATMEIYGSSIALNQLSGVRFATSPPFHAEKVQLMIKHTSGPYLPVFSTVATWGDGSTGSVATSFGSGQVAGIAFQHGTDIAKIKVTETGRNDWACTQITL